MDTVIEKVKQSKERDDLIENLMDNTIWWTLLASFFFPLVLVGIYENSWFFLLYLLVWLPILIHCLICEAIAYRICKRREHCASTIERNYSRSKRICPGAKIKVRSFHISYLKHSTHLREKSAIVGYSTKQYYGVLKSGKVIRFGEKKKQLLSKAILPYMDRLDYIVRHIHTSGGFWEFDGSTGGFNLEPTNKLLVYDLTPKHKSKILRKYGYKY